jgi:hypothetical protein
LHVQKNQVQVAVTAQGSYGFRAITALALDAEIGPLGQQLPDAAAGQGFIIYDKGT